MEIEVTGFAPDLFLHEQKTADWECHLAGCCSTLTATQEYSILDEFPEFNVMDLSTYAEIDSIYHYDPFDAVDTDIVGIITEEYMKVGKVLPNDSLKRTVPESVVDLVETCSTKTPRPRSEDGRLTDFGWKKEDVGSCGKRPRFVYISPTGDRMTSMKKAMAAIRLTAQTKDPAAKVEQSV